MLSLSCRKRPGPMTWPSSARRRATRSSRAARSTTMRHEISTRYVDPRRYWWCGVLPGPCIESPGLTTSAPALPPVLRPCRVCPGLVELGHLNRPPPWKPYFLPTIVPANIVTVHKQHYIAPFQLPANTSKVHALSHITTLHCLSSPPPPPCAFINRRRLTSYHKQWSRRKSPSSRHPSAATVRP